MTAAHSASAQISPGPLARAHAQLEGALNCVKCHGPRKTAMTASCQSCHKEIAWLVERNRGYHASREVRARADCASCHPDHAGAGFALIAWPGGSRDKFDHRQAGWALDGGHADVKCEDCHAAEYRVSESATFTKRTTGAGWTGLETTCASCHRGDDDHRGALGAKCETCHDSRDWKRAPTFSHDSTDYPLTGKHAEVECAECHLAKRLPIRNDAGGHPIPVYEPVPFRSCADCHDDPHQGRLSGKCGDCHTTKGFEVTGSRAFNHALTRYPLKGKHARVSCAACHGADLAKPNPAFDRCASCHRDPHPGTALLAGKPSDCGACHRVEGFAPSTFTVTQHAAVYSLEGKHAQVACAKCHTPAPAVPGARQGNAPVARLRMPSARCTDCHAEAHGAQLATRTDKGACESCHAVAGWAPSTFTVAQHATLRLRLDGRHAEIPCKACHAADRPGLPAAGATVSLGSARVAVRLAAAACTDCHTDAHAGRYARGGALPQPDCTACHSAASFRPSLVDAALHDRFAFHLEGAHRAVACVSCHEELRAARATSTLVRSTRGVTAFPAKVPASRTCESCHQNPHGDQFATRKDHRCESCHGVEAFVPAARFDHERDASFALKGAHARVPCQSCHASRTIGGVSVTAYRPLSGKCESCHDKRSIS